MQGLSRFIPILGAVSAQFLMDRPALQSAPDLDVLKQNIRLFGMESDPGLRQKLFLPLQQQLQKCVDETKHTAAPRAERVRREHQCSLMLKEIEVLMPKEEVVEKTQLWNEMRIRYEQKYVHAPEIKADFLRLLERIKQRVAERQEGAPSVFISYAWPTEENEASEWWVQGFLKRLVKDLQLAGCNVKMDRLNSRYGYPTHQFMDSIERTDFVILVGTKSLLEKHKEGVRSVCTELIKIKDKRYKDAKQGKFHVIPLALAGNIEHSFPPEFRTYTAIESLSGTYTQNLRQLINYLYFESVLNPIFDDLWEDFAQQHSECLSCMSEQEVLSLDAQRQASIIENQYASQKARAGYLQKGLMKVGDPLYTRLPKKHEYQVDRPGIKAEIIARLSSRAAPHFIVLQGMGGAGKTTLAAMTLQEWPGTALWFNGSSQHTFMEEIRDFALLHGVIKEYSSSISPQLLLSKVFEFIALLDAPLVVIDNADSYDLWRDFLPENIPVILTSRSSKWPASSMIEVGMMSEREASALFKNMTHLEVDTYFLNHFLKKTLGLLPLAIAQAGAYIAQHHLDCERYLQLYQQYRSQLFADKTMPIGDTHLPVLITFKMALEQVRTQHPLAEEILKLCAWIEPREIPNKLLQDAFEDTQVLAYLAARKSLEEHALIKVSSDGGSLTLHPLVQEIIYHELMEKERLLYAKKIAQNLYKKLSRSDDASLSHQNRNLFRHYQALAERLQQEPLSDLVEFEHYLEHAAALNSHLGHPEHFNVASALLKKCLAIKQYQFGLSHFEVAHVLFLLGNNYWSLTLQKHFDIAMDYYQKAYDMWHDLLGVDRLHDDREIQLKMAFALRNIGNCYLAFGGDQNACKAIEKYRESFLISQKVTDEGFDQDQILAWILGNIAEVYSLKMQGKEAIKALQPAQQASAVMQRFGRTLPAVNSWLSLANAYIAIEGVDSVQQAIACAHHALDIQEAQTSKDHPGVYEIKATLAAAYLLAGSVDDLSRAESSLQEVIQYLKSVQGQDSLLYARAHLLLAHWALLHSTLEKSLYAIDCSNLAVEIYSTMHGPESFDALLALNMRGRAYCQVGMGEIKRAVEDFERVLKIADASDGEATFLRKTHPQRLMAIFYLGICKLQQGDQERAACLLEEALQGMQFELQPFHQQVQQSLLVLEGLSSFLQSDPLLQQLLNRIKSFNSWAKQGHLMSYGTNTGTDTRKSKSKEEKPVEPGCFPFFLPPASQHSPADLPAAPPGVTP